MGAWGEKAFENDSALDWLAEFEDEGATAVREILKRVAGAKASEYVEADDGSAAIAAAEIVAASLAKGTDRVTAEITAWIGANPDAFVAKDLLVARQAVERVCGKSSELNELWSENGADSDWHKDVRALLTRLT
jgi:hypothetical protein